MNYTLYFEKLNQIIVNLYNEDIPIYNRVINYFNMLMEVLYFDKATIFFFYKENNEYKKHSSISLNWSDECINAYNSYYFSVDDTIPVLSQSSPVTFRSNTFFNIEKRMECPYYKDYLLPNNCPYSIEGNILI